MLEAMYLSWLLLAAPTPDAAEAPHPTEPAAVARYLESRHARLYYSFAHRAAVESAAPPAAAPPEYAVLAGYVDELAAEAMAAGPGGDGDALARGALFAAARALLDRPDTVARQLGEALVSEGLRGYRANYELYRAWQAGQPLSERQKRLFSRRADALERVELGRALLQTIPAHAYQPGSWDEMREKLLPRLDSMQERLADADPLTVHAKVGPILSDAALALSKYPPLRIQSGRVLDLVKAAHEELASLGAMLRAAIVMAPGADMSRSGHYATAPVREFREVWWTHEASSRIRGQPVLHGGLLYYAASGGFQWDTAQVVAMRVDPQEPLWSFEAPSRCYSITLVGDRLYVSCNDVGSSPSYLSALDAEAGTALWAFEAPQGAANALSHPVADETGVYVADRFGALYALDPRSGKQRWALDGGQSALAATPTPALADAVIYLPQPQQVDAVDAAAGERRWSADVTVGDAELAIADGRFYYCHRGVYAVSLDEHTIAWAYEPADRTGMFRGRPAIADGTVFARDGRTLYALDAATGSELWRFAVAQPLDWKVSPVVAGGVVYVGTEGSQGPGGGSTLYAVDAATGRELWSFESGSRFYGAAPVVADGVVFLSADRHLYALR